MSKIKIVALFAPAGAGKDYLLKQLFHDVSVDTHINKDIHEIISQTTRPPREGEVDGVNYYFKTEEEFRNDIEQYNLLEWTEFRKWYYGTNLSALNKNAVNIGVFNIRGIETLMQDPRINVYPVAIKASPKTRLIRQLTREENPDVKEIIRRYEADEKDFESIDFRYTTIENEDWSEAYITLAEFINAI